MSTTALKEVLTLTDKKEVVVRELTPADARKLLIARPVPGASATADEVAEYQLDVWMFEDCRISDLAIFTNLSVAELNAMPPHELRKLIDQAKVMNPDFFKALVRMGNTQGKA